MFDPLKVKKDFPLLSIKMCGKPLVYLDNAATTQKPKCMIDALTSYYETSNSNVHRGLYELSERATAMYEAARKNVADFINATPEEIVFTGGTTESVNLIANLLKGKVRKGDNIVVSEMEHHSNLLPWHFLAKEKRAQLRLIPINKDGNLDLKVLNNFIDQKTKIVAVSQLSNVTGAVTNLRKIIAAAQQVAAYTVVDAAQGVLHLGLNVKKIGADFAAFSGHKMFGPTGVGVMYGNKKLLANLDPVFYGGEMVSIVDLKGKTSWVQSPLKFEAGTPNIADVIAYSESINYLRRFPLKEIKILDQRLLKYARKLLSEIPGITIYAPKDVTKTAGCISFNIKGLHPHDISEVLNSDGIAIRAGHHCCQPLMNKLGVNGTARISFSVYNTTDDIDKLFQSLKKACKIFGLK
jgi:cysteine desulfurase / selenocysteine lyase